MEWFKKIWFMIEQALTFHPASVCCSSHGGHIQGSPATDICLGFIILLHLQQMNIFEKQTEANCIIDENYIGGK